MAELADQIEADPDLLARVPAMFPGRVLTTYIGLDDHAKPEKQNLPYLAMRPGSYAPADDRSHRIVTIVFALTIEKDGSTSTARRTTLSGLSTLEELYTMVEAVLERIAEDDYNYQVSTGELQTEISIPFYRLTWSLSFQEKY
jgi:hypothetical protein